MLQIIEQSIRIHDNIDYWFNSIPPTNVTALLNQHQFFINTTRKYDQIKIKIKAR